METNKMDNSQEAENSQGLFSYFKKPVSNITPSGIVSLAEVYHLIRGETFRRSTYKLRGLEDARLARKYKARSFNYVTFSGIFSQRNEASLEQHSGLMAFDFDHIDDLAAVKQTLLGDPCLETELLFVSPSGKGLKWIIEVGLSSFSHLKYFTAVSNYLKTTYKLDVDPSGKDVSRACFLPFDPEAYIHSKHLIQDGKENL